MKIKCEYCDSMFDDTLESCPNCGAVNKNVRRSTPDQPTTIAELEQWYRDRGLPPYGVTRFYINVDYRNPKAFGIYQDERTGNYVVYKNKADGTRAIRYEGTDEAFAVNELLTRLKQEILEQKSNSLRKRQNAGYSSGGGSRRPRKRKSNVFTSFFVSLFFIATMVGCVYLSMNQDRGAKVGYYSYKDQLYYHLDESKGNWGVYDEEKGEWKEPWLTPDILKGRFKSAEFYLSPDYDPSYGGEDIRNSSYYDDYLHAFQSSTGYYSYDGNTYYHMKPKYNEGWYMYDTEDERWEYMLNHEMPADLLHCAPAQDFWYTPTWDSETQMTDFETTDEYIEYQEYLEESARQASESSDSSSSSDYDWDSGSDSWDSGSTDWDSDW